MKAYGAILAVHIRRLLQYRTAAAAGFATQLFFGLVRVMIFAAFFQSSAAAQPMDQTQVTSYIWLGQAFLLLVLFGPDPDIAELIRTGGVAYELLRPLDLHTSWYARCLAGRIAPMLLRCVPMLAIAMLFLSLAPPASPTAAGLWIVATLGALLLTAAFATLTTVTLLWTLSGEGLARLLPTLNWLFCGIVIPLPLLPAWSQGFVAFLPFRGMLDTPLRIYVGHMGPPEALLAIGHQLAWGVALFLFGRWLLGCRIRNLVVQGG
jgi:ABC-2 type transport system permease protein